MFLRVKNINPRLITALSDPELPQQKYRLFSQLKLRRQEQVGIQGYVGKLSNSNVVPKIKYFYRSEDAYIDFEKNYYQVLEVDEKATFQQIKQNFYLMAKEYHPDRKNGDESIFKELNQAYNVLSQPTLRKQYDQNRVNLGQQNNDQNGSSHNNRKQSLNYDPYSQVSKRDWAVYRQGVMKHSHVDYTNFSESYDPQKNEVQDYKQSQQWNRAFRSIKSSHVAEENQFRSKVFEKYKSDMISHKKARENFYDKQFQRMGDRLERVFGKRLRNFFMKMIGR